MLFQPDFTFGSVCSGIEAASVAWQPLGWKAAWLAEVDVAASQVLAYRLGATAPLNPLEGTEKSIARLKWGDQINNYGDFTVLPAMVRAGLVYAPDMLCGGTPCQGFSIAGLRGGLSDPRGQLTLSFVDLADAIDERRAELGEEPCIVYWENVPGALNVDGNAFGCFLGALAGDDEPLEPGPRPGPARSSAYWTWDKAAGEHRAKWPVSGVVVGPTRTIGWRIGDAQYFGLPQRRRRVVVVASAREGFDPAGILLEFEGLRRDSPPSREAGEGLTHAVAPCLTGSGRGVERTGDPRGQDPVVACERPGTGSAVGIIEAFGGNNQAGAIDVATAVNAHGRLDFESETFVVQPIEPELYSIMPMNSGKDYKARKVEVAQPLMGAGPVGGNQGGDFIVQSVALRGRDGGATAELGGDAAYALRAANGGGSDPYVLAPLEVLPFDTTQITSPSNYSNPRPGDACHPLAAAGHPPAVCVTADTVIADLTRDFATTMAVRRLMPIECHRLQGFPDNWCAVPTGPKGDRIAADGPQYKQLGNSWAVNHARWNGYRIASWLAANPSRRPVIEMQFDEALMLWAMAA